MLLTDFVDDMLGGGDTEERAWVALETCVRFLLEIGVPVSSTPTGIRVPATRQRWVGWIFDTVLGILSVERHKCDKCQERWVQVLVKDDRRELRARELASAAGLSCHMSK